MIGRIQCEEMFRQQYLHRRASLPSDPVPASFLPGGGNPGVPQVPPDAQQDNIRLKMTPLEWVLGVHGRRVGD